jgi:putative heme transporter
MTGRLPDTAPGGQHRPGPLRSAWSDSLGRAAVRGIQVLVLLAVAAVVVFVLVRLRLVVVPVLVALMLAAAVWPAVGWLRRRGVPNLAAAWLAVLAGAAALASLAAAVVLGVRAEWQQLRDQAVEGVRELERLLGSGELPIDAERLEEARRAVSGALSSGGVGSHAASGAVVVGEVVTGAVLVVVVLFFLLKDGPSIWAFLRRAAPAGQCERADRLGSAAVDVLGGYVRGTTVIALVDAVVIGIALLLLDVPLALPLSVLVFLGAYIPLIGAVVTGALASLVALVSQGPVAGVVVLGVVVAVNQLEGDILAPLVLGRAMSLHPLAVLLALTSGAILAGVIGALLAVPLVAVTWAVMKGWEPDEPATEGHSPPRGGGN